MDSNLWFIIVFGQILVYSKNLCEPNVTYLFSKWNSNIKNNHYIQIISTLKIFNFVIILYDEDYGQMESYLKK